MTDPGVTWQFVPDPHYCDNGCKDADGNPLWGYYALTLIGNPAGSYCGFCTVAIDEEYWAKGNV